MRKLKFDFVVGLIVVGLLSACNKEEYIFEEYLDQEPILSEAGASETTEAAEIDIFMQAEMITGCSAEVLRGIAGAESDFTVKAIGDNGLSHGMFQLHSQWHSYRVEKYGEFDPFDPADAAIVAGYIIQENILAFKGDLRLAIAAYRQGVTGVIRKGATDWYVDRVLQWRNDPEKMLAFFLFMGITNLGEEDEYFRVGTQVAYQSNDTFATKVSWRGCSIIPF